ncbi:MAG TPA: hypothetical protein VJN19_02660, partial [Propionibacteriaceae bacterium]|nr:hypothetical protein [Propionibacteriaceae bacterium]
DARAEADRLESVSAEQRQRAAEERTEVEDELLKADRIDPDVRGRATDEGTGARRAADEVADDADVQDRTVRGENTDVRDRTARGEDVSSPRRDAADESVRDDLSDMPRPDDRGDRPVVDERSTDPRR